MQETIEHKEFLKSNYAGIPDYPLAATYQQVFGYSSGKQDRTNYYVCFEVGSAQNDIFLNAHLVAIFKITKIKHNANN